MNEQQTVNPFYDGNKNNFPDITPCYKCGKQPVQEKTPVYGGQFYGLGLTCCQNIRFDPDPYKCITYWNRDMKAFKNMGNKDE